MKQALSAARYSPGHTRVQFRMCRGPACCQQPTLELRPTAFTRPGGPADCAAVRRNGCHQAQRQGPCVPCTMLDSEHRRSSCASKHNDWGTEMDRTRLGLKNAQRELQSKLRVSGQANRRIAPLRIRRRRGTKQMVPGAEKRSARRASSRCVARSTSCLRLAPAARP
ncbi:uncharacterized protein CC84DRAFT_1167233 [Paraphaeosphaeria sporulosa]|uniref:Uncharacterized protein n=1 Tax=Paraphaeosphaeria sporulosa TaxID=1460663 RepID=A0A177C3X3_9PLEO|nr:uncharacterized protein CC84DRAFT_1167233 [Paraphaeosphaeria sporulosa]OAG02106.1 hypothetical protein CC84DRAFT_1167233 [Paraphaeosphaeria sporulosa]